MHDPEVDRQQITEHLSEAVKFRTISHPAHFDRDEFLGLHGYLEEAFPRVHQQLKREVIGEYSLFYTWKGSEEALDPVLLMAHLDVSGIAAGTENAWTFPPFEGLEADGYIWGRGTLDYKVGVTASLEAIETVLTKGIPIRRGIHLCFGHDEEVGGAGAIQVAELLRSRGVHPNCVIDEGLSITDGIVPGISKPVALVGISEKGLAVIELSVESPETGHSMAAPKQTTIGILAAAVNRLEEKSFPARIDGPTREMIRVLASEMPLVSRVALSNLWLFGGLAIRGFSKSPATNATIRTTASVSSFEGGGAFGAIPFKARATLRLSVLPGESIATTIESIRRIVDDARVKIKPFEFGPLGIRGFYSEPSPVSSVNSPSFVALKQTIQQVFPEVCVAPGLVIAATDSRHFADLSDNVFRFCPFRLGPGDLARIHGIDERISIDNYERIVKFYIQLIQNWAM
jgi:carboxypeptidase PM20D1